MSRKKSYQYSSNLEKEKLFYFADDKKFFYLVKN